MAEPALLKVIDHLEYVPNSGDMALCGCLRSDRVSQLPALQLLWSKQADEATVFGMWWSESYGCIITHGELSIRRFSLEGETAWEVRGQDIFTGEFRVREDDVIAHDFEGLAYRWDIESGRLL